MTKLFKIIKFLKEDKEIFVFIENYHDTEVDVNDFNKFLLRHDKVKPNGLKKYWRKREETISNDLYEYLVIKCIDSIGTKFLISKAY